ncbi:MAG: flagellar basal body P-ring protein FlgI [Burkholderiales bacterium]
MGHLLHRQPGLLQGARKFLRVFAAVVLTLAPGLTGAERIKDLTAVHGVRSNQLLGYGLVVGLDGTGDQTTQTPFTVQSLATMLSRLGVTLPQGSNPQLKNVAAVMVTAMLPPFARPGQPIDVTVSSLGNAKSLRGGTLLLTPLKGADGEVYAVAQGNVLVGGVGASAGSGTSVQVNHLGVGRIAGGATVERTVPTRLGGATDIHLGVLGTDFTTTNRIVDAINGEFGAGTAAAVDGSTIRVSAPPAVTERVAFLARIESLQVQPGTARAKIIVNARTGSVVMNQAVTVESSAVAHGNLSVVITSEPVVSQPGPLSAGQTVQTERSQIEIRQDKGLLTMVRGASLGEVVKALNAIGATPQDLLAILQAMKASGALRAELEII